MSQDPWKIQEYEDNNWINLPERLVTQLLGYRQFTYALGGMLISLQWDLSSIGRT